MYISFDAHVYISNVNKIHIYAVQIRNLIIVAEPPPPELSERGIATALPFYADVKVMLPLMIAAFALLAAVATVVVRWKTREFQRLTSTTKRKIV